MNNKNKISVGNAGEYFVAGELERRGFTCAVPMSNTKDFDILAISRETHNQYAIQVKTASFSTKKWPLHKKSEDLIGDNIFYVFVALNELETPCYHIVPSSVVANYVRETHKKWLETPGKKGQAHRDNTMRSFRDDEERFLDRWDYLD